MTKNEEITIANLHLLLRLAKLYGFSSATVTKTETGKEKVTLNKCHFVYSTVLQIFIHVCGYLVFRDFLKQSYRATNGGVFYILKAITEFAGSTFLFITCIYSKVNAKSLRWLKLVNIEGELQNSGIIMNHKIPRILTIICIIYYATVGFGSLILILLFEWKSYEHGGLIKFPRGLYYHYQCVSCGLLNGQYIFYFAIINEMFEKLEDDAMKKYVNRNYGSRFKSTKLLRIAKYHQQICELAREGNSAMCVQMLFEITEMFWLLTVYFYDATVSIINNAYNIQEIIYLVWVATCLITIAVLATVAHHCMSRVSPYE